MANQQKQEVELAVLGRGEYKLREKFKHLEVSSQEWESMREEQKKKALQKLHKVTLEEATSSTASISKIVRSCDNAILKMFIENGIDSSSVCAHSVCASIKQERIAEFIKWLSYTKRNAGGINFSKAITFGMPKGRGGKGEKAPRKVGRSKTRQEVSTVVPRVSEKRNDKPSDRHQHGGPIFSPQALIDHLSIPSPSLTPQPVTQTSQLERQQPSVTLHSSPQLAPQFREATQVPSCLSQPALFSDMNTALLPPCTPSFPSANPGQFMLYLLQFCPSQTSVCFGCGNPLKHNGLIPEAPNDLVIVSKMAREWMSHGKVCHKLSNVYFHCFKGCVQRKEPRFIGKICNIPEQIQLYLLPIHHDFIRINL